MLPIELLRTKIYKGKIFPIFCSVGFGNGTNYELANKLTALFENVVKTNQRKNLLLEKKISLESEYDYKLVRGLFTILERRAVFGNSFANIDPIVLRKKIFEESTKSGLALTDSKRDQIIQNVVKQYDDLSKQDIEKAMWGDKEENLLLMKFHRIDPKDLLLWYNFSLAQTLLFRCTNMEFYVEGGIHWKQVLRNVKKFGLMYNLEEQKSDNSRNNDEEYIKCRLEGPLSLFKLTDRYGTSMAKLLSWITRAPTWNIAGSIIKKNDYGRKIYQFSMSNEDTTEYFQSISNTSFWNNDEKNNTKNQNYEGKEVFDSLLEEKFEKLFKQHFDKKDDWKIKREPNPLIANGKAMIPDFVFERYDKKVYFEIVGFWTKDYLKRKTEKLKSIFDKNKQSVDLLVAVNSDLACSQLETISSEHIFSFKKEVPIKPILKYLRKIDSEIIKEKSHAVKIRLDEKTDIIPIVKVAEKYNIPIESTLMILSKEYPDHTIINDIIMMSNKKLRYVESLLSKIVKFNEACNRFDDEEIPESCHADLLSKLNYDVIWEDLDPNNAIIKKKL